VGGGGALDDKLHQWHVQVDGGGTWDQVEDGGVPRVKGGILD
jgi:hypothetical protein